MEAPLDELLTTYMSADSVVERAFKADSCAWQVMWKPLIQMNA